MKYIDLISQEVNDKKSKFENNLKKENKELIKYYRGIYKRLSRPQKRLILEYTNEYYKIINYILATSSLYGDAYFYPPMFSSLSRRERIKKDGDNIVDIINKCSLPEDTTVYRGTSYHQFDKANIVTSSSIKTLIISSTSLNPFVARNFGRLTHGYQYTSKYIIMEFDLPKGYPALYTDPFSNTKGEYEIILGNESTFEIVEEIEIEDTYSRISNSTITCPVKIIKLKPKI